jgi:esterase/lipase superfamily enzyme
MPVPFFVHRLNMRIVLGLVLALTLAGCEPRWSAKRAAPPPDPVIENVYVATERRLDSTGPSFGVPRNSGLRYFRADISIPPNHKPGDIEWPKKIVDPMRHFVVTQTEVYDGERAFVGAVRNSGPGGETLVFVHGYNNTLSEAMYRLAQIRTDFSIELPSVLYSWPSGGDPRGYIYDRDSVLFARDDLEGLLQDLTARPGDRVTLLAHSMGSHLVMEVMRQAALKGDRALLSRISSVILMSPDLDPDLFRRQAEAIGVLPDPFLIFVSQKDQVLNLASLITGRKPRLGVIDGPEAVAGLDVSVIDFTALSDGEGMNHTVAATSPAAISVLSGMIKQAAGGTDQFRDYMVLTQQP